MDRWSKLLGLTFIVSVIIRLVLAFSTPHFTFGDSYFTLRQVENILRTGIPIIYDNLSYQGTYHVILPLFYYIIAVFAKFFGTALTAKIIPNVFASLAVFAVYFLGLEITRSRPLAVVGASLSIFNPLFLSNTFNSISVYTLLVPLQLYLLYLFIHSSDTSQQIRFAVLAIISALLSSTSLILVVGFVIYFILIFSFGLSRHKSRIEYTLFYSVATLWITLIIYKDALSLYGLHVFWQNIPTALLDRYFTSMELTSFTTLIGIIPLIFGLYVIYYYIFRKRNDKIYILLGFLFANLLLFWTKTVEPTIAYTYITVILVLLFIRYIQQFTETVGRTQFEQLKSVLVIILGISFVTSLMVSSITFTLAERERTPTDEALTTLRFAFNITRPNSTILAPYQEGNIVTYYARRMVFMDSNFMLAPDVNERLSDTQIIYTTPFDTERIRLLNKYDIDYIYISGIARQLYNMSLVNLSANTDCFLPLNNEKTLYEVTCTLG